MSELAYGRDVLYRAEEAGRLEWLVTNGLGGFAAGTVSGALTRRYHGLLFAALRPPLDRVMLLAKLSERLSVDGQWLDLDTNHWVGHVVHPAGHVHLESFRLENTVPTWTWAIGDTRLEKRVWMEHGENTTCVQYRLRGGHRPVRLVLRALVNHRDAHGLTARGEWSARVEVVTGGFVIEAFEGATPLWLSVPGAEARPAHEWYRGFALAIEAERGLDCIEDHLLAGEFSAALAPGEALTVVASTRREAGLARGPLALASALARRRAHERSLLDAWRSSAPSIARGAPGWVRRLVLAADAFVVERATSADPTGRSIMAGYPWFTDWGRDTMIALPGLALATGRPEIAKSVLSTYARHVDQGMLPNVFPDGEATPHYNTVDAALWFFQAVRAYHEATTDDAFLESVYPVLEDIRGWYERGTRFGIGVDSEDGLVRAGEPGVQLTWMDAKVDDWVVTPRIGKPVEVNALWYSALHTMARFAVRLGRAPDAYETQAKRVAASFARFWNPEHGGLFDVLDGPEGIDDAIRPNQLFAVSLPDSPLTPIQQRAVVEICGRRLVTSHGLRSLAAASPGYCGVYEGDRRTRDAAYHQGTVWTWLLPHFALAHYRVHGDRDGALAFLTPFETLLGAFGVGSLPEVADGDPPHRPRGCFAQAWSVGEALRVYHAVAEGRRPRASHAKPRRRMTGVTPR